MHQDSTLTNTISKRVTREIGTGPPGWIEAYRADGAFGIAVDVTRSLVWGEVNAEVVETFLVIGFHFCAGFFFLVCGSELVI